MAMMMDDPNIGGGYTPPDVIVGMRGATSDPAASGAPNWLPPGAVLNPDGSITMPNGTVLPAPPAGSSRDPNTGAIIYPPGTSSADYLPGGKYGPQYGPGVGSNAPPAAPQAGPDAPVAPVTPPTTTAPASVPPAAPASVPPAAPTTTMGSLLAPFDQTYTAPTPQAYPTLPTFTPPPDFQYDPFAPPTLAQAQAQPGYQFQLQQGEQALEQSAAGQGILRTGGTLKNILDYGQNAAQTGYATLYNQNLGTYQTNRANAADTWQKKYQSAYDQYQPLLSGWQTKEAQVQRDNEMGQQNAWKQYLQKYDAYRNQKMDTNAIVSGQEQLGLNAVGA